MQEKPWYQTHINFLLELMEDKRHTLVMSCVDCFSEMVHLVPLFKYDIQTIADRFLSTMVIQNGLVECIMSDHDPQFCGPFWDELMALLDTTLTFATAFKLLTTG